MADAIVENLFLVNAPAGSGKTTWIRKNVRKYLLQNPMITFYALLIQIVRQKSLEKM